MTRRKLCADETIRGETTLLPGNNEEQEAAILEQVKFGHFTATPIAIGPFGKTALSWAVTGPSGFNVQLNGATVARSGGQTVEPRVNTGYTLSAKAGNGVRTLGSVSVKVDTTTCAVVQPGLDTQKFMLTAIQNAVLDANKSLSVATETVRGANGLPTLVPTPWTMNFSPGSMHIKIHLLAHVDHLSPSVDVAIDLGLVLDDLGDIQTFSPMISGTVSDSWLLDLVPVLGLIVSLKDGAATDKIPMEFQPVVNAIPALVKLIYPIDPSKQQYQTIAIPGDPASPPLKIVACAKPLTVAVGSSVLATSGALAGLGGRQS